MRWDSPFVLTVAATLAIHTILIVTADAVEQYTRDAYLEPAPHIELVDVEMPAPPPPPPPEPLKKEEPPPPPKPEVKAPVQQKIVHEPVRTEEPPAPPAPVPPTANPDPAPGGEKVASMDDITGGRGVPVAHGNPHERMGRNGTGGGTGGGSGSGAADAPKPASVATIKTRAMPKGDQSYFSLGKDYPAEARQLNIEGPIRVRLVVDETGKVTAARLLNSLGHGLDELALTRAKAIEFEPAKDTDDKPVTSVVVWTFDMRLPE